MYGNMEIFLIPSGKLSHNYGKIHHFECENSLFLWPFSIAMLNYQRVTVCYGKVSFLRGFLVDNVDISIVNDAHLLINQQTYQQWWFQLSHMMVLT